MKLSNIGYLLILLAISAISFAQIPPEIGTMQMQGPDDVINLRVIDSLDAGMSGNGVLMVVLPDGTIGAADLVDTTNQDASGLFINTNYGIRAWRGDISGEFGMLIGGDDDDFGSSAVQTADSNFVIAGVTKSFGAGESDIIVVKISRTGDLLWAKSYGGSDFEGYVSDAQNGAIVLATSDGGLAISTVTISYGAGRRDYMLMKLDSLGNLEWTRVCGGLERDGVRSVIEMFDGGFMLVGWSFSYPYEEENSLILRYSADGTLIWARILGSEGRDKAQSVIEVSGGSVVVGWTEGYDSLSDFWVTRLSGAGYVLWSRSIGSDTSDYAFSCAQSWDDGLLIEGWTAGFGAGDADFMTVKLTSSGDLEWAKTLGGTSSEKGYDILRSDGTGITITGHSESYEGSILVRLNTLGYLQWARVIPSMTVYRISSFLNTLDGGYLMAGNTDAHGAIGRDVFIVKFSSDGHTCLGTNISPSVHSAVPHNVSLPLETYLVYPSNYEITPEVLNISPHLIYLCP